MEWDNFQFFLNLCLAHSATRSGEIIFDERCHGYSKASNVIVFLAQHAPGLVFAQLILMLLLAVFGTLHRFGKVSQIANPPRISNLDFISGLSNVYRRAHANLLALEIIGGTYRSRWCKLSGVSVQDNTEEIQAKWSEQNQGNISLNAWCEKASGLLYRLEN